MSMGDSGANGGRTGSDAPIDPAGGAAEWHVCGRVIGAFGVQGALKVEPVVDPRESVLRRARQWRLTRAADGLDRSLTLRQVKAQATWLIATGTDPLTREDAESLKGAEVLVRRDQFPRTSSDEYYWADLVGCSVRNPSGEALGVVRAMDDHGAHPFMSLDTGLLIPFVEAYVLEVDIAGRAIVADWSADWR